MAEEEAHQARTSYILASRRGERAGESEKLKHGHSSEDVARKIPVYVAYFTAWPDMSGKVEYFNDVYDRDSRLKQALDATEAVRSPSI